MLILGIDDAGRGPVIGPMVLAGCLLKNGVEDELVKLGVKDSKQLTPKRREFLAEKIRDMAENFEVVIIYPNEIDDGNKNGTNLNDLEAFACARIINKINEGDKKMKVIVDCPSVSLVKWGDFLRARIDNPSNLDLMCEHKADRNHVAVSAASILAKSEREKEMGQIKEKYGDKVGSGYTSDPLTQKFLEKYAGKHKDEGIFRKTWITWKRAYDRLKQRTLG